ncbi:MAG: caspase family protein [Bradyrhizobium sp.]
MGCGPARAEKRVALVIGNSAYKNVPRLTNPAHDAALVAGMFRKAGFDQVMTKLDLDASGMREALRQFGASARDADIAVIYYAGHGMEMDGNNYLIPTDATLQTDAGVLDETVPLDRVLFAVEPARQLRLIILDACRDNPFAKTMKRTMASRGVTRGLAKVEPSNPNTLIAFAAKAGSTALDGDSQNGPFAKALVKYLPKPGLDLRLAFGYVRDEVLKNTGYQQEPYVYGSLGGDTVSLIPAKPDATASQPNPQDAVRKDYELALQLGTREAWNAFLAHHPDGFFIDLAKAQLDKIALSTDTAAATPSGADDAAPISDLASLNEVRQRLYELNFDPDPVNGPATEATHEAIRGFQRQMHLPPTATPTVGLLRRLREAGTLQPWGTIVYDKRSGKWGMAWGQTTRKAAVAQARVSCGDAESCPVEISFFGTSCAAFAYSKSGWAIVARDDIGQARRVALSDCRKGGKSCEVAASVCANGTERYSVAK